MSIGPCRLPSRRWRHATKAPLFSGENGRNMFFVDRKARAVNDVLTVRIADVTSATGEANTNTSRASSVAGNLDNVFGYKPGNVVEAQLKFGFDGKGTTTRKNALSATVTAVVREVFPNGNLFVEGSKEVIINNERQYITVTGVVRPGGYCARQQHLVRPAG